MNSDRSGVATAELARRILDAIRGVRFGSVEIVIHDGQVVQIERRERMRLERQSSAEAAG